MAGFPYHTDIPDEECKFYLSNFAVDNCSFFYYGFVVAVMTKGGSAFAEDVRSPGGYSPTDSSGQISCPAKNAPPSPPPTSAIASYAKGKAPILKGKISHGVAGTAACASTGPACATAWQKFATAAMRKDVVIGAAGLGLGAVCIFSVGYCAGKATTVAINKYLGLE
jgi:hypothetical protein